MSTVKGVMGTAAQLQYFNYFAQHCKQLLNRTDNPKRTIEVSGYGVVVVSSFQNTISIQSNLSFKT